MTAGSRTGMDLEDGNQLLPAASKGYAPGDISSDDGILVSAARHGDGEAYARLLERHSPRIYTMLLHVANGDHQLAAELVQEAFSRAWERLDQFHGECAFSTWLWRLARNRAIDILRRKRPQAMSPEILAQHAGASADHQGGCHPIERQEQREMVQQALAQLPEDSRELLLMRDFAGHDYATIAATLEVPLGTVKSRIARARGALREHLAGRLSAEDVS